MFRLLVVASVLSLGFCMPGGYYNQTDPAEIQKYVDILTGLQTSGKLALDQYTIQGVATQVVAGKNIRYTLENLIDGTTCNIVVFDQVWTQTRVISSNTCDKSKTPRQLGGGPRAGGYSTLKTDAAEVQKCVDMLTGFQKSGMLALDQFTVQGVETQVVSGLNSRCTLVIGGTTCHIVVWDQPWTQTRQITSNDCPSPKPTRQLLGGGGLLGGWNNVDVNTPDIQDCLSMSLDSINAMSNNMYRLVDSRVISATEQVVAGTNYGVTFETLPSSCMNSGDMKGKTSTDCAVNANSNETPVMWKAACFRTLELKNQHSELQLTSVNMESAKGPQYNTQVKDERSVGYKPISSVVLYLGCICMFIMA